MSSNLNLSFLLLVYMIIGRTVATNVRDSKYETMRDRGPSTGRDTPVT